MLDDQNLVLNQFFTLWAMLDPLGHLPLFLGATSELDRKERRRAAMLAVFFAFCILLFFGIAGQFLLHAMGISLISFQIAGGIILLLFAISMVLGEGHSAAKSVDEPAGNTLSVAVYPLATPIIAGPGAMLAIIILTDNNRFTLTEQVETFGVLAVVLSAMLVIFTLGDFISNIIGKGGTNILRRVMGVILAALSVNLIVNALVEWLHLPAL
ncbi:MarC family protein [Microvirga lenta]|uniref:MarC family protein n=1 Tax=Microvirga lenta TaxID=2881337 RepID=UPI001CFFEA99|nr:MarC family protein [Microvirga lenta]MCB5177406.1 MarC family protein [Microvirga lenta]